jgi:hypothetical protein
MRCSALQLIEARWEKRAHRALCTIETGILQEPELSNLDRCDDQILAKIALRTTLWSRRELCLFTRLMRGMEMNLWIWLPLLFLLGAAAMGALFVFLAACEKV